MGYGLWVVSCELWVMSYELWVMGYERREKCEKIPSFGGE